MMKVDIRSHQNIREVVRTGLIGLKVQARQIWGDEKSPLDKIIVRLMVGVGDIARNARDRVGRHLPGDEWDQELKKELGNVIFSTIRWIDDLGLDPLECLDLAIDAQEKFVASGRPQ